MSAFDLIVRGAEQDIGVTDGRIAAMSPDLEGGGREELDARGLLVLPGVVDAHVHLNDPGRADWEGFPTGTRALAAGGSTTAIDMPLNASPPTVDAAAFDAKVAAAAGRLHVDMALWGGIVPGNLEALDELAARGVVGFKAFMSDSGIADFPAVDDDTLGAAMARAAALGRPVAVHAEDDALTRRLAAEAVAAGRRTMRDYRASRPIPAEVGAIERAVVLAEATGCALHVVHVSSGVGVGLVAAARSRGIDVTCETCPHYLVLDEDDADRLGALAKCAPPIRPAAEVEALWERLAAGDVTLVATDHSPAPASMKTGDDAFSVWGGISGAQTLLALMLDGGLRRGVALGHLVQLLCAAPAARFGLAPAKGALEVGADADLVLVDQGAEVVVERERLLDRHRLSPYVGRRLRGRIVRTILRGETVARDGRIVGAPRGRILAEPLFSPAQRD
jgi:allantoinase